MQNYIDHFTGCVLISAFVSLVSIPIVITSYKTGVKICAITAEIKNYKSIIETKREAW